MPRLWLNWYFGTNKNTAFLPEQADITCILCFCCYSSNYFPMQKSLKMISRISSAPTRPVILPRLVRANRTPSAARARSMSRYCWYCARAVKHCCRWALWRAWVRVGAPDRGSPHLERKLENKMNQSNLVFCAFGWEMVKTTLKWQTQEWKCSKNTAFLCNSFSILSLKVGFEHFWIWWNADLNCVWMIPRSHRRHQSFWYNNMSCLSCGYKQNVINYSNSQSLDTAVQHCEEVLQSFISVARDQRNRRESRDPSQLSGQLLPLLLRQQVRFIQHQETPVCRRYRCKKGRETEVDQK